MDLNLNNVTLIASEILAAVTTHALLRYQDPVPLYTSLFAFSFIPLVPSYLHSHFQSLYLNLTWAYLIYFITLSLSVTAYRLSPFHRLAKYPGPIILKVTKLSIAWIAYRGIYHRYLKELHDRYGPTVRIGPNELSTVEKGLITQILGNHGMPKGPLWDGRRFGQTGNTKGYDTLVDVRDPDIHPQLRKPWNKAFTSEPMADYEAVLVSRLIEFNDLLKELCARNENGIARLDIAQWITHFSFDFMGDFALGGNFRFMRDGDVGGNIRSMTSALRIMAATQNTIWLAKLVHRLPVVQTTLSKFANYCVEQAFKRSSVEVGQKDLFYHLGEAAGNSTSNLPLIVSNVILAIVAGSDTSISVLCNAVYLLASSPSDLKRLREEIDAAFEGQGMWDAPLDTQDPFIPSRDDPRREIRYSKLLGGLEFLNAVINETLRLFPAVPTTVQRAPARGTSSTLYSNQISIFLSDSDAVTVPPYVLHRDPRYFSPHPNQFIPDRWMSESATAYTTVREAFIPFSIGPQNCAGRALALLELRYGIATLVKNFDIEFDIAKRDPLLWEKDLKDWGTFGKGALDVKLRWRGVGKNVIGKA